MQYTVDITQSFASWMYDIRIFYQRWNVYKIKAALQTWYFIQEQGILNKYRNARSGKV